MLKNIYIITDTHLGHKNIVKYCNRPPNHEELILSNLDFLNDIKEEVILVHMGDVAFGNQKEGNRRFLGHLTSPLISKMLIRGNHDKLTPDEYRELGWNYLPDEKNYLYFHTSLGWVVLSHYPVDHKDFPDAVCNIHGHFHINEWNNNPANEKYLFYDPAWNKKLSIEETGYKPLLLEDYVKSL